MPGDGPYREVVGRVVVRVEATRCRQYDEQRDDAVVLVLDDGRGLRLELDAECCSRSYFADVHQFDELVGARIQAIEEREGVGKLEPADGEGDRITPRFLIFTTDRGYVTVDWRNDSNGYYDGWVVPSLLTPDELVRFSETP